MHDKFSCNYINPQDAFVLCTYLINTLFSAVLSLGLCTFFFGIQGVLSPRERGVRVFYVQKFLSPAEVAVQYFPLLLRRQRDCPYTSATHTMGSIVIFSLYFHCELSDFCKRFVHLLEL